MSSEAEDIIWVPLLKCYLVGFFNWFFPWFTCWISYGYVSSIGTLGGSAWMIVRFTWYLFLLNFSCFVYWSFSGYASSIGILRGFSGDVSFIRIPAKDINASLCEYFCFTSRMSNAVFCSALIKSCTSWMVSSADEILACWFFWGEIYCVWDPFCSCFWDLLLTLYVVLNSGSYVPSGLSMWCLW